MQKKILRGLNGKTVTMWIPETDEDKLEIARMHANGQIDADASFGDKREKVKQMKAKEKFQSWMSDNFKFINGKKDNKE